MRRALLALGVVAALAFSACTTGTTTNNTAEPKAVFPSSQPTVATGQGAVVQVVRNVLPAVVNVVADSSASSRAHRRSPCSAPTKSRSTTTLA